MIQVLHFGNWWHFIFIPPPLPEPAGWWSWWYIPLIFALWSMGAGVTAKLVWAWDRIPQWESPAPLFWPFGVPYYIGSRLTRRWLIWRDFRKNCKLAKNAK